MKISNEKPPIYDEAHKHFKIDDTETIYTYGDVIYNPGNIDVTDELIAHESVHAKQQEKMGGPDKWWRKYFDDPVFRVNQEADAYGQQYKYFCTKQLDGNVRTRYLFLIAGFLASPLYGVEMRTWDAVKAIKNKAQSL
jgi:hypothetical protein